MLITWALTLGVVLVVVVRGRAKRADRKRDAERRAAQPDQTAGRTLF
jgi:hypothetical protein